MLDLLTDLTWVIIITLAGFAIVYSLVRLAAIAWHRTKAEYYTLLHDNEEHPEREHPERE